jgi:NAD(P)H-flavin reductase
MVKIEPLTETEKLFTLYLKGGRSLGHQAGQFVEVSVFGIGEAPISVTSSPSRNGTFELCVRQAGDVTGALHRLEPGSTVGIRGPFGNGFPVDRMKGKDLLFAPGGLGFPPLRSLINQVLAERESSPSGGSLFSTEPKTLLSFYSRTNWLVGKPETT